MWLRWSAAISVMCAACFLGFACSLGRAATRPHYGGTLHVEVRESIETADPPQTGPGMADLAGAFSISRWEGGRLAVYSANDDDPGGRPYLDSVEIQMARAHRDQAVDLELGRADVVELGINEIRRPATTPGGARRIWNSEPVRLLALVFATDPNRRGFRVVDARVREAIALSVDRGAIHNVLLQRQGEIAGSLLPQWISGYAFLFPTAADPARARMLAGSLPLEARTLSLSVEDAEWRAVADRIALNARDAGLVVSTSLANPNADLRLVELRSTSSNPAQALAALAAALGLPEPPRAGNNAEPEALFSAERSYLADFKLIPLFHLP
jgi:peptide/nickel transport system substrate-binding protein